MSDKKFDLSQMYSILKIKCVGLEKEIVDLKVTIENQNKQLIELTEEKQRFVDHFERENKLKNEFNKLKKKYDKLVDYTIQTINNIKNNEQPSLHRFFISSKEELEERIEKN